MTKILLCIAIITLVFSGCMPRPTKTNTDNPQELKGEITISGAFALYPLTVRWANEFNKEYPGIAFHITAGGAGKGITDAMENAVSLGMVSREITGEEASQGAWFIALAKDAVLPTINASNPCFSELRKTGVTAAQLKSIYTGQQSNWGQLSGNKNDEKICLYKRSDQCGATSLWSLFLGCKAEDIAGKGIDGDEALADSIKNNTYGIGYNNLLYVYDSVSRKKMAKIEILPVDLDENGKLDPHENFYDSLDQMIEAIQYGKYPSPPARSLYFVSKGEPTNPAVIAFIKWTLTEGQHYIKQFGYVTLSEKTIKAQLQKIN